ncbi:MAG: hypothetical protein KBT08_09660 [Bacteroidales bacterium]|nr:hypothetical protein [Candidatus Cryptobacteroides onthequi]
MKKVFSVLAAAAVAALGILSCSKEQMAETTPSEEGIQLNITVGQLDGTADPDTKAVKTGWASGDRINIWYDENISQNPDLVIVYDGSKWAVDHSAAVSGKMPAASGTLTAMYVNGSLSDFSYAGEEGSCRFSAPRFSSVIDGANRPARMPLVSFVDRTDYSFASNILTSNLADWLFRGANVQVVISGLPAGEWALKCDRFKTPSSFNLTSNSPVTRGMVNTGSAAGNYALSVANKDGRAFMYFCNGTDTDFNFTLFNTDTGEKLVYSVSGKSLDATGYKLNAIKIPFSKFSDHRAVDLGLSVKWASMNIGATKPEDYGWYFAWGETSGKSNYSWSNEGDYKWGIYDSSASPKYGMTKYTADVEGGDGLKTLQPGDDPATVNWGTKWRTPTLDEIKELLDNTKCEWAWDATKNGYTIKGLKTGNSIFLPAPGHYSDSDIYNVNFYGGYWSSSLSKSDPRYAYIFNFTSYYHEVVGTIRCNGHSVRAVTE